VVKKVDVFPGYKTYAVVVVGVVVNALVYAGVINPAQLSLINTVLTFLGIGTVRSAVGRK